MSTAVFRDQAAQPWMTVLDGVSPPDPNSPTWWTERQARVHRLADELAVSPATVGELFVVLLRSDASSDPLSATARSARIILLQERLDPDLALLSAFTWRHQRGRGDGFDLRLSVPRLQQTAGPLASVRGERDQLPTVVDSWEPTRDLRLLLEHRGDPVGQVVAVRTDGRGLHVWCRLHPEHTALAAASIRGTLRCSAGFHIRRSLVGTGYTLTQAVVTEVSLCRAEDAAFAGATVTPALPTGEQPWPPPAPAPGSHRRQYVRGDDGQTWAMSAPVGHVDRVS